MARTAQNLPAPVAPATIFSHGHHLAKAAQHPYVTFFGTVIAPRFWLFLILAMAGIGPQLAFLAHPVAGTFAAMAALVGCMVLAVKSDMARLLAISVGILPLATLVTLCLPQADAFSTALVFYDAVLVLALVYRFMFTLSEPTRHSSLGFWGYCKYLPGMLVIGQALGVASYWFLQGNYQFDGANFGMVAAVAVVFAIAEEMLLRGLIQQQGSKIMHPGLVAALTAVLFASLSIGQGNWAATGLALVSGAILSAVYYTKPNLLLTMTLNITSKLVYLGLLANFAWGYFRF